MKSFKPGDRIVYSYLHFLGRGWTRIFKDGVFLKYMPDRRRVKIQIKGNKSASYVLRGDVIIKGEEK